MKTTTIKLIALSLIIIMMLTSGTYAVAASPTLPLVDGEYLPVEDTSYEFATISSSTNSDRWSMTPAKGFVNFYFGSLISTVNYTVRFLRNGNEMFTTSNNGATNILIKCRVDGTSKYSVEISSSNIGSNTSDKYLFRYKTFESNANITSRVFYFSYAGATGTQTVVNTAIAQLNAAGLNAYSYVNNSAAAGYSVLPTSDIYLVANDTLPGYMRFNKSASDVSYMYASKGSLGSNEVSISNIAAGGMSDAELVIFARPYTGATSTYGNLVDMSVSKGAFCAIGFKDGIYNMPALKTWTDTFFTKLGEGKSVYTAISMACSAMVQTYGDSIKTYYNISKIYYTPSAKNLAFN